MSTNETLLRLAEEFEEKARNHATSQARCRSVGMLDEAGVFEAASNAYRNCAARLREEASK